jgi:hypothetical protein
MASMIAKVISSLHVATGALAGALLRSPRVAFAAGPVLHALGDRMPHEDIGWRAFELWTSVGGILALGVTRGPLDAATVGGFASALPDAEHVLPFPRPGGKKLFPSHRLTGWHMPGGVPASVQVLAAGAILGGLVATGLGRRFRRG